MLRRKRRSRLSTHQVYFLLVTADGVAGVPRTVSLLAGALADQHDVEIISVYRRQDSPHYPADPRVRVTYLYDQRAGDAFPDHVWVRARRDHRAPSWQRELDRQPSAYLAQEKELSGLSDELVKRKLESLEPGVLVTVRPALHALAAELAPPHVLTIAQDHLNFPIRTRNPRVRELMGTVCAKYDALVPLTQEDAVDYAAAFPDARAVIRSIPNATSFQPVSTAPPLDSRIVVAGGRLEERKGFHRLVEAYAPVAAKHPDWRLHIYGRGPEEGRLRRLIEALGFEEQIVLKGFSSDFASVLSGASVYAMASLYEGFPMVLLEAMSRGLPLVSFDCPRGPGELIDDGRNGRLVADGDIPGLTQALLDVIEDGESRSRMGREALRDSHDYGIAQIAQRWEQLFQDVLSRRD